MGNVDCQLCTAGALTRMFVLALMATRTFEFGFVQVKYRVARREYTITKEITP